MRNDRVPIPVLHVAHDAKCFFAVCILAFLSTTLFYHKNNNIWVI